MIEGQLCLACVILTMVVFSSPFVLALQLALMGALWALSYNNSLFHGVSGSINRTGRMAIHEALLAALYSVHRLVGSYIKNFRSSII